MQLQDFIMISYTNNSLHDGDFPNFKMMKARHSNYKHYFISCDANGYQISIYKNDEELKKIFVGDELPSFKLSEKTFEIYRYDGDDEEITEKHHGAELVVGLGDRNPMTFHFDHMKDAGRFIKVMLEAYD